MISESKSIYKCLGLGYSTYLGDSTMRMIVGLISINSDEVRVVDYGWSDDGLSIFSMVTHIACFD